MSNLCLADTFSDYYHQASAAFEQGDYATAVLLFNKAKNLKNGETHALDFNIGSSLYKWKKYISAYQAFESASQDPNFYVLSHINMALCAAKLNDKELLSKHLIIVSPLVSSQRYRDQLLNIATEYELQDLLYNSPSRLVSQFDIAIGRQYKIALQQIDSNNLNLAPVNKTQADANYVYSGFNVDYQWHKNLSTQLSIQDISYYSAQRQLREYNYRQFSITPTFQFRNTETTWSASFSAVHSDLADRSFQNQSVIVLKTLSNFNSWSAGLYLRHRSLFSTDPNYRYLQGRDYGIGTLVNRTAPNWSINLDISLSENNREDYRVAVTTGNDAIFQSYSPKVGQFASEARYRFNSYLSLLLNLLYRVDRYPDDMETQRRDHRGVYGLGLQQAINKHWQVLLNYQRIQQNSTLTPFDFDSRLIYLATRYNW